MEDWYASDEFWNDLYVHIFSDEKEEVAETQVVKALKLAGIVSGTVLDMPCGPGRHAGLLADAGFSVTGVDLNKKLLARTHERHREIETVCSDMREFVRPASFDFAISMFNSLGYFESEEEDLRIIQNIHKSLKPGGRVLFELVSKEYLARIFEPVKTQTGPDGSVLVQHLEVRSNWSRVHNRWILKHKGTEREFCFEQTVYSGHEMESLMHRAGFETIALYGNLDGAPYDEHATRLIAVGTK